MLEIEVAQASGDPPTLVRSLASYFREWRYQANAIIACVLSMYVGWIALAGSFSLPRPVISIALAAATTVCMVLAIFLINDAADRDIDKLVHPERPIPRGLSQWQHIYGAGVGLILIALACATFLSSRFLAAVALQATLVIFYYSYLKRFFPLPCSSELIAPLISALFPVTAFAVVPEFHGGLLIAVACFIYSSDMAQDLLGGIHDETGDRRYHVRTFAVALGSDITRWISATAFIVSVGAGVAVFVFGALGWIYLVTFSAFSLVMLRQYLRVLLADRDTLPTAAGRANHLGGAYYFVVSASILPDLLLRQWLA
ncbi:MAG: geranylgeranylglycerol-phosphate geranylgeranyltransferase [Tardiphaga sp.]|uniref:UbiA family prenyltransferase n=1 Tax=Tardiphaga sp. TaxID=1926292 RepID=UPI00260F8E27|nr:UbiA family prenyltransferase [Tardiphaga sp.]MDB5502877.1 geranylgeranylglycerol-phosphate geranylgeranyltransferase [Tardiphaga sp.]